VPDVSGLVISRGQWEDPFNLGTASVSGNDLSRPGTLNGFRTVDYREAAVAYVEEKSLLVSSLKNEEDTGIPPQPPGNVFPRLE
jgi:hypothetical protein